MAGYTDKVKKILRENNCRYDQAGKGDHEIWYSPINNKKFPVDYNIKSRHTANGILKQAGIEGVKIS